MNKKNEYKKAFSIVKQVIAKIDPYSLLETGSPQDEFDSEVGSIVKQLPRCKSSIDIAHTIARVLTSSFGDKFEPDEFKEYSEELFNSLKDHGLIG